MILYRSRPGKQREELDNARRSLPLLDADPRLGWHQDVNGYQYNGTLIREKIAAMAEEVGDRPLAQRHY